MKSSERITGVVWMNLISPTICSISSTGIKADTLAVPWERAQIFQKLTFRTAGQLMCWRCILQSENVGCISWKETRPLICILCHRDMSKINCWIVNAVKTCLSTVSYGKIAVMITTLAKTARTHMEGPLTGQLYLINYESVQAFWFIE